MPTDANAEIQSFHQLQKLLSSTVVIPNILFIHKAAEYSLLTIVAAATFT